MQIQHAIPPMRIGPQGKPPGSRPLVTGPLLLALFLLPLFLLTGATGCGYTMDAPGLPEGHRTLAVDTVRNETFTAEVDVRLQRELRRQLFRDAAIRVVSPTQTDLLLQITVKSASASRSRGVNDTSVSKLAYNLSGSMTLLEQSSGRLLVDRKPVSGTSRLNFAERTVETPAVREEGLNDAITALAGSIVQELLVDF